MSTTQDILEEIAAIIRRVGKRDEIETEIVENISFSEIIADQLKIDGPVKEAVIKVIATYVKDMEITSDDDAASEILEAIDFKKFVPTLLQSKDFQETLGTAVENLLENGDLDLSTPLGDAIGDDEIKKVLGTPAMQEVIVEKLKSYVEDFDMSNLGDDFYEKLDDTIFSRERIEACFKGNSKELDDLILKQVESYLDNEDGDNDSNPIIDAIGESKAFKTAVDKAVDDLVDSGKVTRLVEKVATDMLSGDDSELRSKLTQVISVQLVSRIATSIVSQALK